MVTQMNLKQMYIGSLSKGTTTVYTVGSDVNTAVIKEFVAFNSNENSANITVFVNGIKLVNQEVDSNDVLFGDKTWYIVLNKGDSVAVSTNVDGVNVLVGGVETVVVD